MARVVQKRRPGPSCVRILGLLTPGTSPLRAANAGSFSKCRWSGGRTHRETFRGLGERGGDRGGHWVRPRFRACHEGPSDGGDWGAIVFRNGPSLKWNTLFSGGSFFSLASKSGEGMLLSSLRLKLKRAGDAALFLSGDQQINNQPVWQTCQNCRWTGIAGTSGFAGKINTNE